jgi:hypothetical protein
MREIPLTQGQVAIVDDGDYDALSRHKWFALWRKNPATFYARRRESLMECAARGGKVRIHIAMHQQIMGSSGVIDHRDHNGLNNTRGNLRIATTQENARNKRKRTVTSSRFKGVSWNTKASKWHAQISFGPTWRPGHARQFHLGSFSDEESAARAYDSAARIHFGDFAILNFGEEAQHGR